MPEFITAVTWENQAAEQIELTFSFHDKDVQDAFLIVDGEAVCPASLAPYMDKICESMGELIQVAAAGPNGAPFRLSAKDVGDGIILAVHGSPLRPTMKAIDPHDDGGPISSALAVLFEAAARIQALRVDA